MNDFYRKVINMQVMARDLSAEVATRISVCRQTDYERLNRFKGMETKIQGIKDRLMELDNELYAIYGAPQ